MGQLFYDATTHADIDDRALAHLQIVILNKLRRRESIAFTWRDTTHSGFARATIWIAPELPLRFQYASARPPAINAAWVEALMLSANTSAGLHLVPEPETVVSSTS